MTGQQWAIALRMTMYAHGPQPSLDQLCAVASRCYPQQWVPRKCDLERMIARYQLDQEMKAVAYRRETASERGEADVEMTAMFGGEW